MTGTGLIHRIRQATRPSERERGVTIVELIVSMGMFVTVLAIFMAAVVTMSSNAVKAQATADAGADVRRVFQRLDKQVRYTDAITTPGAGPSGAQYVELRTPATSSASGYTVCTQWRWVPSTKLLQMRTWRDVTGAPGTFITVADNVVADPTVTGYPFALAARTAVHPRQELTMNMTVKGAENRTITTESTFVARNSADTASVDTACTAAGLRP